MCDNSLLADQFRMRLAEATEQVDEALENVRSLKTAILATMAVKDSADTDRDIYVTQEEYVELKMAQKAVERVRLLAKDFSLMELKYSGPRISQLICQALDTNEEWLVFALDGEQS